MCRSIVYLALCLAFLQSSCSPSNPLLPGTTGNQVQPKRITSASPTSTAHPLAAIPTLNPYCDYDPSLDQMGFDPYSGPEDAGARIGNYLVNASLTYTTSESTGRLDFVDVLVRGDCRITNYLLPLLPGAKIEWIAISSETLTVDLLLPGPEDDPCCPTIPSRRSFSLIGRELVEELPTDPIQPTSFPTSTFFLGNQTVHVEDGSLYPSPLVVSVPPGSSPLNLPAHVQLILDPASSLDPSPSTPIAFIIPLSEYLAVSGFAQPSPADAIQQAYALATSRPDLRSSFPSVSASQWPFPATLPALPSGWLATRASDIAVAVTSELIVPPSERVGSFTTGLRYVGHFAPSPGPISDEYWYYVYQGFSDDGRYFLSLIHPLASGYLRFLRLSTPESHDDATSRDDPILEAVTSDIRIWEPSISDLDQLAASITVDGIAQAPPYGLWYWQGGEGTVLVPSGLTWQEGEGFRTRTSSRRIPSTVSSEPPFTLQLRADGVAAATFDGTHREYLSESLPRGMVGDITAPRSASNVPVESLRQLFIYLLEGCLGEYRLRPLGNDLDIMLIEECTVGSAYLRFSRNPDASQAPP